MCGALRERIPAWLHLTKKSRAIGRNDSAASIGRVAPLPTRILYCLSDAPDLIHITDHARVAAKAGQVVCVFGDVEITIERQVLPDPGFQLIERQDHVCTITRADIDAAHSLHA